MKSIVIIGPSTRAFADSWRRAGWHCLCVDQYADDDLKSWATVFDTIGQLQQFLDETSTPSPLAWVYTGPMEYEPIESISSLLQLPCWGHTPHQVQLLRSMITTLNTERWKFLRLPVRYTRSQLRPEEFQSEKWLCKPVMSSAGKGVSRLTGEILDDLANSRSPEDTVIEAYISGNTYGLTCVGTDDGIKLLGVCRSLRLEEMVSKDATIPSPFLYTGSIGPLNLQTIFSDELQHDIHQMLHQIYDQCQPRGLFGIDMIVGDNSATLLEINPRFPASAELLVLASGNSVAGIHANCFEGTFANPPQVQSSLWIKRVLYARETFEWPSSRSELIDWNTIARRLGGRCSHENLQLPLVIADLPTAGSISIQNGPVLTVYCSAQTETDLWSGLEEKLYQLKSVLPAYIAELLL